MQKIINDEEDPKCILDDMNGRVGKTNKVWRNIMRKCEKFTKNNNWNNRLTDSQIVNKLVIENTIYQHKAIDKYTRVIIIVSFN